MVTITNVLKRTTSEGKDFFVLELSGGIEINISQTTGKNYATTRKTTIPCTMDEIGARQLIGMQLEGEIIRINCDPYEFVNPQTNEKMVLTHKFVFQQPQRKHIIQPKSFLDELDVV